MVGRDHFVSTVHSTLEPTSPVSRAESRSPNEELSSGDSMAITPPSRTRGRSNSLNQPSSHSAASSP